MQNSTKAKLPNTRSTIRNLQDIFALAGTSTKLAARLNLHAYTVEGWRRSGIPQRYWDRLFDWYGITPGELYLISKQCRQAVVSPSRVK